MPVRRRRESEGRDRQVVTQFSYNRCEPSHVCIVLAEGWPTKLSNKTLEITFDAKNGFHKSAVEKNRGSIEAILAEFIHVRLRIVCVDDENGVLAKLKKIPVKLDKQEELSNLEKENPIIKDIIDTFDADLIR